MTFTTENLVSFGNYLLSDERIDLFASHPEYKSLGALKQRLSQVHHSDIENRKVKEFQNTVNDMNGAK